MAAGALVRGIVLRVLRYADEITGVPRGGPGCYRGTTAGFPGGHVAGAMVGAGVVCVHRQHLPLYGGGLGDALACGVKLASASLPATRAWIS